MLNVEQLREVLAALARAGTILENCPGEKTAAEQRLASLVAMARRETRLQLNESTDPWGEEELEREKD